MNLRPGDRVRARRERWSVESTQPAGDGHLVRLRGVGSANLHEQRAFLTPFDHLEKMVDPPVEARVLRRRRWCRLCRAIVAAHGPWSALRAVDAGDLDVLPHQLEPALAVVRGLGSRVLLADDVGLGKTIEAGLLIAELTRRGAVEHTLLLTPAGLRQQWQSELLFRFGLSATIVDLPYLRAHSARLPPGVNPWMTMSVAVASIDFIKRPEVLPLVKSRGWDLVVVDEAHGVSPDSDRYAAVEAVCALAAFVVLATATPHNGDRTAFDALCSLGSHRDPLLVFRRTRSALQLGVGRHVHQVRVRRNRTEADVHAALDGYAAVVRRERGAADPVTELLLTVLWKRALSSAASLRRTIERRLEMLVDHDEGGGQGGYGYRGIVDDQPGLPLDDGGGDQEPADEAPVLTVPALHDPTREARLLRAIRDRAAEVHEESKLRVLKRLLNRLGRVGESTIVFTEYRDTLIHVRDQLGMDAVLLHGGMTRSHRQQAVDAFTSGSCRLLLATDAGGEGLNLHRRCRTVVHLELPWNPTRLEQRIGRVDRIGQQRRVHSFYLVLSPSGEVKLLSRLHARVATARQDVQAADPLISTDGSIVADQELAPDSRCEAERIRRARRLRSRRVTAGAVVPAASAISATRGRTRAALNGRILLLLWLTAEDATARAIASGAAGLLVELPRPLEAAVVQDLAALRGSPSLAEAIHEIVRRFGATEGGLDEHAAFWSAYRRRTAAIASHLEHVAGVFQPGLFDKRAERLQRLLSSEHVALTAAIQRRHERGLVAGAPPAVGIRGRLVLVG